MSGFSEYVTGRIAVGVAAIVVFLVLYGGYIAMAVLGGFILYFVALWAINHPGLIIQYGIWVVMGLSAFAVLFYFIGEVAVRFFGVEPSKYTDDGDIKSMK